MSSSQACSTLSRLPALQPQPRLGAAPGEQERPRRARSCTGLGTTVAPPGHSASHEPAEQGKGTSKQLPNNPAKGLSSPVSGTAQPLARPDSTDKVTAGLGHLPRGFLAQHPHYYPSPQVPGEPSAVKEQGIMAQNMFWKSRRSVSSKLEKTW